MPLFYRNIIASPCIIDRRQMYGNPGYGNIFFCKF